MKNLICSSTITLTLIITFSSLSGQILTEDFEGGSLPTGWTQSQNGNSVGWEFGNISSLTSNFFNIPVHSKIAVSNDDKHDDVTATANTADADLLRTPVMDLTGNTNVYLIFETFFTGDFGSVGTVQVTVDGGTNWNTVHTLVGADNWNSVAVDLSAYTSSTTVEVGFNHDDNGLWASGFAIDNVDIRVPPNEDAAIYLNMAEKVGSCEIPVLATIQNLGTTTITDITVSWELNGDGNINTQILTGLSIAPTETYSFTHQYAWNAWVAGTHTMEISISDVNSSGSDDNSGNDIATQTVIVIPSKRLVLVEHFTSASCGACLVTDQLLEGYMNDASTYVVAIANHTQAAGIDPMYSSNPTDISKRTSYYGVGAVLPWCVIDGNYVAANTATILPINFEDRSKISSDLKINNAAFNIIGDTLYAMAEIEAINAVSGDFFSHMVVIERRVDYVVPPGSNNNKHFEWVMKTYLPDAIGTIMGSSLSAGQKVAVSEQWVIKDVNDNNELGVIYFVQNNNNKEVLVTAMVGHCTENFDVGINEPGDALEDITVKIYPTITNSELIVDYYIPIGNIDVSVSVFNSFGQLLPNKSINRKLIKAGEMKVNVSNLSNGIYFISVDFDNKRIVRKFIVVR
ncbi:MAG: T9SS type A sorting domain-containing protein [Bacteroidetes bacterium]|nr:T9SS type A sorting domain-containing protein [Bacteroidota bacterium]